METLKVAQGRHPRVNTWQPAKHALTGEESEKLLKACCTVEEKFVILLMLTTGARRGEICNLQWRDFDLDAKTILIRNGKGGKSRTLPMADSLVLLLQAIKFKNDREFMITGRQGRGIKTESGFWYFFQRIARRAGLDHIHPHTLRHTFAMTMLKHGASIYTLKDMLGHTKVSTTEMYLHGADMEMMREALEKNPFAAS